MEASLFLRATLDNALKMLDHEAKALGLEVTDKKQLIPFELFNCNSIGIIKGVMQVVLFEKNYTELAYHYKNLEKKFPVPLPEFDDLVMNHIQIQGMGYPGPINTPTLVTPYGELVLGLPDLFVAEFYRGLTAAITPPKEGDNVVQVDFNGKKH